MLRYVFLLLAMVILFGANEVWAFDTEIQGGQCDFPRVGLAGRQRTTGHGTAALPLTRPPSAAVLSSERFPLLLHYQDQVEPQYARDMLTYVEEAWQQYFNVIKFLPPLPDGPEGGGNGLFDVYIVTNLNPGIGGYAGFDSYYEPTPRADAVGYLVINNNIHPKLRRFVVAHELFHASQMAYDFWEDLAFMEASANVAAEFAFPDDDIYWRYVPFFQAKPYQSVDFIRLMDGFQYGALLWPLFLEERYGKRDGALLKRIWEHTPQDNWDNEPDYFDAITTVLSELPSESLTTLADTFREFGVWRFLLGPFKYLGLFKEAATWADTVFPFIDFNLQGQFDHLRGALRYALEPFSHGFIKVTAPRVPVNAQLTLGVASNATIAVDYLTLSTNGFQRTAVGIFSNNTPIAFKIDTTADDIAIVITNLGANYDPDEQQTPTGPIRFDLRL